LLNGARARSRIAVRFHLPVPAAPRNLCRARPCSSFPAAGDHCLFAIPPPLSHPPLSRLLERLPRSLSGRLATELRQVPLDVGRVLLQSGPGRTEAIGHGQVYFLRSGTVSVRYTTEDGETGEILSVGNEGMVGLGVLMGAPQATTRVVVQAEGEALVMRAEVMEREFRRGGPFQSMVLCHTRWLMAQLTRNAICNRHHTIERQLCRWILLGFDRQGGAGILRITHEALAHVLGVRREGVTEAARRLRGQGAISYGRGWIRMEDRQALEGRACECFRLLHADYQGLCHGPEFA